MKMRKKKSALYWHYWGVLILVKLDPEVQLVP
jgi:hypothetical protein